MSRQKGKQVRDIVRHFTYSQQEFDQIKKNFAKSSCRTLVQYIREMSLKCPFNIHRNRAFDQFVEEVIELRKEMQAIRETKVLSGENEVRLLALLEEIKNCINKLIDLCMQK